jgi:hypothetical protein
VGLRNLTTRPPDTKVIRLTHEKETVAQIAEVNVGRGDVLDVTCRVSKMS